MAELSDNNEGKPCNWSTPPSFLSGEPVEESFFFLIGKTEVILCSLLRQYNSS